MKRMTKAVASPVVAGRPAGAFSAMEHARSLGGRGARILIFWQISRTVLRIGFSAATAIVVGHLVMGEQVGSGVLVAVPTLLLATAVAGLVCDRVQTGMELTVAAGLRAEASRVLQRMDARTLQTLPAGTLTVSMQRHPPAIAALVISHRAATTLMALGPLIAAAALFCVSWQAALLMLLLTPVMIIFFALVGETIRTRADAQERAFGRLAGQFADRMRTLPTILSNHALNSEEAKLADRLSAYAANTMSVLRIAFLNAGIIDFFASLSIAMLAVFLGLGHLKLAMIPGFSNLELWQSLFILMIAPDYFAPFRRFSEQYHAKAEGIAAAAALDRLLGANPRTMPVMQAVDDILRDLPLPSRGLVVVAGPSGSGKSTLLRRFVGIEPGPRGGGRTTTQGNVAWISSDAFVPQGTMRDAIAWNAGAPSDVDIDNAAAAVGLLDDELLPGGLDAGVETGGANLSGGQRLRIAVARAKLVGRTVIADEPTAKLDSSTATMVRQSLRGMADRRLVLVASHDADLIAIADRVIRLSSTRGAAAA